MKHNRLTSANCSQTTGERLASSVASHGGGVHRGLMGATLGWGATARWGMEATVGVGGQQGGGISTCKNHSSHQKYKSPKQFELKGSKST